MEVSDNISTPNLVGGLKMWSLLDTITGIIFILSLYIVIVLKILPEHMKKRPPYQLKNILLFYNAFQVAYSGYVVVMYGRYLLVKGLFTSSCAEGETMQAIIRDIYPYFIAKHLDLLDTVFFVLRKKDNQITFLHLYHHSSMITWTWLHQMYHPTDHFVFVGILNSFVHVLMYAYYGISSLGPEYAKFIWWKKHLTKIQLVQFTLVVSHLHFQQKFSPCPIPQFFHYYCMTCIISFFVLFLKFYFSSYKSRRSKSSLCEHNSNSEQSINTSKDN